LSAIEILSRKIRKDDSIQISRPVRFLSSDREILLNSLPRKTSKIMSRGPVPQTDTGGQAEKAKANG
jgi:hypothetical protein